MLELQNLPKKDLKRISPETCWVADQVGSHRSGGMLTDHQTPSSDGRRN